MKMRFLVTLLFAMLLNACGFHLKGERADGNCHQNVFLDIAALQDENKHFVANLQRTFEEHQIAVVAQREKGAIVVKIDDLFQQNSRSASGNDKIHEVQLNDGFHVAVTNGQQNRETVISSKTYIQYNAEHYLANRQEEDAAHQQLESENISKLIQYITHSCTP